MSAPPALKLYQHPSSPNCIKVRAVAYEIGVDLDLATVNIFKNEARSPELRALNPNGLVPVLVADDFVLWESNAILSYLAEQNSSLAPASARERADVARWLHWQSAHLGPAVSQVAFERFLKPMTRSGPTDHDGAAAATAAFRACGRVIEASLPKGGHLSSRLSVADFAIACMLRCASGAGLSVDAFPNTRDWLAGMLARSSMRRALAEARSVTCTSVGEDGDGSPPSA